MSEHFRKFSSIDQFSNVVKGVRMHCKKYEKPLPKITFYGSVKLHGTNACIAFIGDEVQFQSRERTLSYESDNAGFCNWGLQNIDKIKQIGELLKSWAPLIDKAYLYGEWCCGNVQAGVALNQIAEKKFAVFELVLVDFEGKEHILTDLTEHEWMSKILPNILVIDTIVPSIELEIDFNEPHLVQNYLLEKTLEVEAECPFAKHFGASGTGEGLVWRGKIGEDHYLKFKTKGEKHSVSKVKTVRELTDAEIASKENAKEFVEYALTDNRLKQGIDKLSEMGLEVDIKSTGAFLKWIGSDVLKECTDVLVASNIERKDVMPVISDKARQWFMNYLNENA